jgi:4-carboxymuconolactone decarboxylase
MDSSKSDDRWQRGLEAYASQFEVEPTEVFSYLEERIGPRMATEAIYAAGAAWTDDVLSLRDRSLIVLAALAAQGGVEPRMRPHVRWAIEHGATPEELEAMMSLLAVYVGYPRASVAMQVVREVLEEMRTG